MESPGNTLSEVRLFSNYQQRRISRSCEVPLAIITSTSATFLRQEVSGNRAQHKKNAFMGNKNRVTQATVMASCKLRDERRNVGGDVRKCSLRTGRLDASRNVSAIERR